MLIVFMCVPIICLTIYVAICVSVCVTVCVSISMSICVDIYVICYMCVYKCLYLYLKCRYMCMQVVMCAYIICLSVVWLHIPERSELSCSALVGDDIINTLRKICYLKASASSLKVIISLIDFIFRTFSKKKKRQLLWKLFTEKQLIFLISLTPLHTPQNS